MKLTPYALTTNAHAFGFPSTKDLVDGDARTTIILEDGPEGRSLEFYFKDRSASCPTNIEVRLIRGDHRTLIAQSYEEVARLPYHFDGKVQQLLLNALSWSRE